MQKLLSQIPMFSDLTPNELKQVSEICHAVVYSPGERICREGQPGDFMLIIEDGSVFVYRETPLGEKAELATLERGAILGEMALVDSGSRSANAVASVQVNAFKMYRKEFMLLRAGMSPVAFKLMKKIALTTCKRLREINRKIMQELSGEGGEEPQAPEASDTKLGLAGLWNRLFGGKGS